jgi:4-oxalocrotonate tautomerase
MRYSSPSDLSAFLRQPSSIEDTSEVPFTPAVSHGHRAGRPRPQYFLSEESTQCIEVMDYDEKECSNPVRERRRTVPFVNIRVTREGVTAEQKAKLIRGVTDLLKDVLGKPPQSTMVVIDEVEMDNWGVGGESVTERRKKG